MSAVHYIHPCLQICCSNSDFNHRTSLSIDSIVLLASLLGFEWREVIEVLSMSCESASFQSLFLVLPIAAAVVVFRLPLQSYHFKSADSMDGGQATAEVIKIHGCASG